MKQLIMESKVIICAGTGGVGKTTVSASLAAMSAQLGRKTLVLTIDPSRRLAGALGISKQSEPQKVKLSSGHEFTAQILDVKQVFLSFIRENSSSETMEKIVHNRVFQQLTSRWSGSQEFGALEFLYRAVKDGDYDLVILDTPPASHLRDFLNAPERFYSLFQDSVISFLIGLAGQSKEKVGFFRAALSNQSQWIAKVLSNLTGAQLLTELSEFFENIQFLKSSILNHSIQIQKVLCSPQTKFVMVGIAQMERMGEMLLFQKDLSRYGYALDAIIFNRMMPGQVLKEQGVDQVTELRPTFELWKTAEMSKRARIEREFKDLHKQLKIVFLPEIDGTIDSLKQVEVCANLLKSLPIDAEFGS